MLKKLFSKEQNDVHTILRIFGIKIKYLNKNLLYKKMQASINDLKRSAKTNKGLLEKRISAITPYRENSMLNIYLLDKSGMLNTAAKKRILARKHYEWTGKFPDLNTPKTFNEKINWMKLYYDNPLEKRCVDKYEFKKYIQETLGDGYTIPAIGVYESMDDIDFDALPEKFVVKSTIFGGGYGIDVVKDKSELNINRLKYNFTNYLQEWRTAYYDMLAKGYEGLKPRVIIEEYMPIREGKALEYKFFCFHGEVKFCLIECDYFGNSPKRAYCSKDFEEMPFSIGKLPKTTLPEKPANYDKMVELADKLSKPFPFVRVDFYDLDDKIYIGEFTFTSGGGFSKYSPDEWDYKFGEWLDLNKLEPEFLISK